MLFLWHYFLFRITSAVFLKGLGGCTRCFWGIKRLAFHLIDCSTVCSGLFFGMSLSKVFSGVWCWSHCPNPTKWGMKFVANFFRLCCTFGDMHVTEHTKVPVTTANFYWILFSIYSLKVCAVSSDRLNCHSANWSMAACVPNGLHLLPNSPHWLSYIIKVIK